MKQYIYNCLSRCLIMDYYLLSDRCTFTRLAGNVGPQLVVCLFWPHVTRLTFHKARFVPFAIFVCSASLIIMLTLYVLSTSHQRSSDVDYNTSDWPVRYYGTAILFPLASRCHVWDSPESSGYVRTPFILLDGFSDAQ